MKRKGLDKLVFNATNDELSRLYKQYMEWRRTNKLLDNEFGHLKFEYDELVNPEISLMTLELDLLKAISVRWYTERSLINSKF